MSTELLDSTPRALRAIASFHAAVEELAETPTWALTDDETLDGWQQIEQVQRLLDSLKLQWLHDIDHRGAATATGATSTARWVQDSIGSSPGRAWSMLRLTEALDARYRATAQALREGCIGLEHAQVITRALDRLPASTSAEVVAEAERTLLEQAEGLDARQLATAAQYLRRHVDADAEDRMFEEEQRARAKNWFSMDSDPDQNGGPVAGWLDAQSQAQLAAALRPLSAPRLAPDGSRDPRLARERRGEALVELARRACNTGGLPDERGQAPHVMVLMDLETLEGRIGGAQAVLEDGMGISAAEGRRIACDARLIPVVLGGAGEVLDVGRASSPVTAAIRRALVARDGGCVQPGCGRPAAWADAHHVVPWSEGGVTSLTNTCLLCEHHHRLHHGGGWTIRMAADGHPEVLPPPWHRKAGVWQPAWRRRPDGTIGAPP